MNLGIILSPGDSLTRQAQTGQLDRLIRYYLENYAKKFNRVYIFSYGDAGAKFPLPENIFLLPKPFFIPAYFYQLLMPFIYTQVVSEIDFFRVFQAPGGIPALISRIFFKKPYVVSNNYDYVRFARIENKLFLANLLGLVVPLVLKHAATIITPDLIPNGVDPLLFRPDRARQAQYLVLSVGRLACQKNYPLLLKTVSLSRFKSKIALVIIGSGPLQDKLMVLAQKLQVNLRIIPNVSHRRLVSWYQQAHVFALTSLLEGQSKVLLEAMSAGCACLTTPFSGNIIQDNFTGLIGSGPRSLAAKLDRLLSGADFNRQLGVAARQSIIRKFNIHQLVVQEMKLYVK